MRAASLVTLAMLVTVFSVRLTPVDHAGNGVSSVVALVHQPGTRNELFSIARGIIINEVKMQICRYVKAFIRIF